MIFFAFIGLCGILGGPVLWAVDCVVAAPWYGHVLLAVAGVGSIAFGVAMFGD